MKYRSRTDIISMILEAARSGSTRTRIMYKAYLSYAQVLQYLKFLQEQDLVTYEKDKQLYRLTEKGLKYLDKSNKLNELMIIKNSDIFIVHWENSE